jgi:hypothetical protein
MAIVARLLHVVLVRIQLLRTVASGGVLLVLVATSSTS